MAGQRGGAPRLPPSQPATQPTPTNCPAQFPHSADTRANPKIPHYYTHCYSLLPAQLTHLVIVIVIVSAAALLPALPTLAAPLAVRCRPERGAGGVQRGVAHLGPATVSAHSSWSWAGQAWGKGR